MQIKSRGLSQQRPKTASPIAVGASVPLWPGLRMHVTRYVCRGGGGARPASRVAFACCFVFAHNHFDDAISSTGQSLSRI